MNYNKGQLGQMAKQYGFVRDTFEKVLRLKEILTYLNADEYLHKYLALKGGTAINMTIFNLPRLSVDLDLDFTPNLPLEDMEKARRKITEMLERYMTEEGYFLSESSRYSHSLDSMFPVLRRKDNFNLDKRKEEAKKFIEELMVLTPEEVEYLELFEKGEYRPEFLFGDDEIIWNIKEHPMAVWKMKNEQGMKMMF